jgi:hypothetical protein
MANFLSYQGKTFIHFNLTHIMKESILTLIDKVSRRINCGGLGSVLVIVLAFVSCTDTTVGPREKETELDNPEVLEVMLKWSHQIEKTYTFPIAVGSPPPLISRHFALYHVAMHDALNSVKPRYSTYASGVEDSKADPNAALIQAVYDVFVSVGPESGPERESVDSLYTATMGAVYEGDGKERGIALGKSVALSLLAKRGADTPYLALLGYDPTPPTGTQAGVYQYLPPLNYALAGFHLQSTWVIASADQFRPGPPDPIDSPEYTADYNEVKALGEINSTEVTEEQRYLGLFWAENSSRGWNRISRELILQQGTSYSGWEIARLFALVHIAIADSYIAVFDSKMHYNYWRPISAIRNGDSDGNDETVGDPNWTPAMVTPAVGEYPSAHAISGAAAAGVLTKFFGTAYILFTTDSGYMPTPRTFESLDHAVRENSLSRIYIGYHFRKAVEVGEAEGYKIGDYVFANGLKKR